MRGERWREGGSAGGREGGISDPDQVSKHPGLVSRPRVWKVHKQYVCSHRPIRLSYCLAVTPCLLSCLPLPTFGQTS